VADCESKNAAPGLLLACSLFQSWNQCLFGALGLLKALIHRA